MVEQELQVILENTLKLQKQNPDKALHQALKGLKKSESNQLTDFTNSFYCQIGNTYFHKNNYELAIKFYQKALDIALEQNDKKKTAKYLIRIGVAYQQMKHFKTALTYFFDALQYSLEQQNGVIYNNIASIYYHQKNHQKAIQYLETFLKISKKYDNFGDIAGALINLSIIETETGNTNSAINRCVEAQQIAQQHDFTRVEIYALLNIGNAYIIRKEFEYAKTAYTQAYQISKTNNYSHDILLSQKRIAEVYQKTGRLTEALNLYLGLKKQLTAQSDKAFHQELLEAIIKVYKKLEDYQSLALIQTELIDFQREIIKKEREEGTRQILKDKQEEIDLLKLKQQEIEEKNKTLSEFAYIVAHDLKEPLRSITGFVNLLQKRLINIDDDAKAFLEFIVSGTTHMNDLLRDLLKYVELENQTQLKHELVDLNEILYKVMLNLSNNVEQNNAKIYCEHLPKIYCNDAQMVLLFQNLIHNAIKFHQETIQPIIHIKVISQNTNYRFEIEDNGIGIAPLYQKKIFKIFNRLNKQKTGTGIGLAISQKIVQQHNGNIWLESQVGTGSKFFFTLKK